MEILQLAGTQIAKKGSVAVREIGKFSIRAARNRKGVQRTVVARFEPSLQLAIERGDAPEQSRAAAFIVALGEDKTLRVPGLGSFEILDEAASTGVHPRTGKTTVVPARRVLAFSGITRRT
ncbi:MAG: HU family DNA-binding protein [Myxococcota bacterium]